MRIIIAVVVIATGVATPAFSQKSIKKPAASERGVPTVNSATPSKTEIQSQMNEATNDLTKQIADLQKQLKATTDPDEKKSLQEQVTMLQKQVTMMQGLNKNLSGMSSNVFKQAAEEGSTTVPIRDATRISIIPKKKLSEAELAMFIKNVHAGVEKLIPAAEKAEALNMYNETKARYKSTAIIANAANGCWMLGHWEKALYIMGRACSDDITDADNLNNYAAFLIMAGGEQAALPILEYLNEQYPNNSTILNNIGQAWYGLGELDQAKKFLSSATMLYANHSTANSTLSDIAVADNDPATAISELKASLKETYDPEKETQLRKLGYEIKFDDMPPLNYPMEKDPYGFIPLINTWDPNKIQSTVADGQPALALQSYIAEVTKFDGELKNENADLNKKLEEQARKLAGDSAYRRAYLDPYNCPAYLLARRSMDLYCVEHGGLCLKPSKLSPFITGLWLPAQEPFINPKVIKPVIDLVQDCEKIWFREVEVPWAALSKALTATKPSENCADEDAKMDAFLAKQKEIYERGVKLIQAEFSKQSDAVTNYIKYSIYGDTDDPDDFGLTMYLIAESDHILNRRRNRNHYYNLVNSLLIKGDKYQQRYQSNCKKNSDPDPEPDASDDVLAPLKVRTLECKYIKHVKTPGYKFKLKCNTVEEEIDSKLDKRKPDVPKGSAHNTTRNNSTRGPIQNPHGPNVFLDEIDDPEQQNSNGPLTAEKKDISQFSLEYDKWGNLVGFNFQLSEDGSTLKDPDSVESDIDSRWSWNAVASPKKGHLHNLLLK